MIQKSIVYKKYLVKPVLKTRHQKYHIYPIYLILKMYDSLMHRRYIRIIGTQQSAETTLLLREIIPTFEFEQIGILKTR